MQNQNTSLSEFLKIIQENPKIKEYDIVPSEIIEFTCMDEEAQF